MNQQSGRYMDNRELSWLKFNSRVLEEAEDKNTPLFERLRFLAIYRSNMNEFFMIRVGALNDQMLLKKERLDTKTFMSAEEQLAHISERVRAVIPRFNAAYSDIMNCLYRAGIVQQVKPESLSGSEEEEIQKHFEHEFMPLLTPSVIDKRHPNHFLKNLEIYAAVVLKHPDNGKNTAVGIVPAIMQGVLKRIIYLKPLGGMIRFMLVEDLILHCIGKIFANYLCTEKTLFKITRNADLDVNEAVYDEDMELDFREIMEEMLKKRKRLTPVGIDFHGKYDTADYEKITSKLHLNLIKNFTYLHEAPLDFSFLSELEVLLKNGPVYENLFYEPLIPQPAMMVETDEGVLKQLDKNDILLSYPYESINTFIRFLEETASDPDVFSIKVTLYRVARDSKIINALITAAENGKDVLALVELRARFDEENNIGWSMRLEEAGVNVMYGLDGLKVHSKLLLVTKKSGTHIKYYTQIGTGNYNERTAKLYTDLTLMTSAQDIGADASLVFAALSVGTTVGNTSALLVAPKGLKSHVVEMIDTEIVHANEGYIGLKLNSLTDRDIIEKLVEASKKGVKVELLIRGICCLIAGVKNETENITVISVVGRFLEHSRIYIFGKPDRQRVYISSADFMTRNTEKRVEVAAPIRDKRMQELILEDFHALLTDNSKARIQNPDGTYSKPVKNPDCRDIQVELYKQAYRRAIQKQTEPQKQKSSWFSRLFKKKK